MSVRDRFVKRFGEEEAKRFEFAAEEHANDINSKNKGKDPFKWALLICIGYQCFEKEVYRKYHRITAKLKEINQFIIEDADLGTHDGDFDYLSLFAGVYNKYVSKKKEPR